MAELWPDSSFYFIVHELTHFKEDLSLADICNIGYNMGLKLSGPMQLSKRKVGSLKEAVDFIYKRAWRWLFSNSACRLDKSPQALYHCDAVLHAAEASRALHFASGVLKGVAAALGVECYVEPSLVDRGPICFLAQSNSYFIKTLKIKHLQAELSSRNLSFAGKKEDLVQRLTTAVLNERSAQTVARSIANGASSKEKIGDKGKKSLTNEFKTAKSDNKTPKIAESDEKSTNTSEKDDNDQKKPERQGKSQQKEETDDISAKIELRAKRFGTDSEAKSGRSAFAEIISARKKRFADFNAPSAVDEKTANRMKRFK